MKHCPNRIITLVTKLTLKFLDKDALLCKCEHLDYYEPITKRLLRAIHYSNRHKTLSVLAIFAFTALYVCLPIMISVATVWICDTDLASRLLPRLLTVLLIGVVFHKICSSHILFLFTRTKINHPRAIMDIFNNH